MNKYKLIFLIFLPIPILIGCVHNDNYGSNKSGRMSDYKKNTESFNIVINTKFGFGGLIEKDNDNLFSIKQRDSKKITI